MKDKYNYQRSIAFTEKMKDKIQDAAETLNVSFSDIVRGCVENDLDKLIDREIKRTKRRTRTHTE